MCEVWILPHYYKRDKRKTSVNYSRKGLFWVGREETLFAKVTILWRKTKTQSHMSPHIVQTMISYCSPELDRILFLNLLCCLTSSRTWLIHLVDNICVCRSTHLPKLKKRNPSNPSLPNYFKQRPPQTRVQWHPWASLWMMCALFHHTPVQWNG
jgi:hypothetical protein